MVLRLTGHPRRGMAGEDRGPDDRATAAAAGGRWCRPVGASAAIVEDGDGGRVYVRGNLAYAWDAGDAAGGEPIEDVSRNRRTSRRRLTLDIRDASPASWLRSWAGAWTLTTYGSPQPISGFGGEPAPSSQSEATLNLSGLFAFVPSS